jgi:hypothetical protein
MIIKNKQEFYRLASLGLCGNTPKTWKSIEEYWPDRKKHSITGVRRIGINNPTLITATHFSELKQKIKQNRITENTYIITVVPIDEKKRRTEKLLQGEFSWVNGNYVLFYALQSGYMRWALKEFGKHAFGFSALNLMKQYCTPSDYQDIMDLFDKYTVENQYPTIEFSVLSENIGRLQGRNTLIWEIRHY